MNKKFLSIVTVIVLTLAVGMSASAASIQRINLGYLNMDLTCVDYHAAEILGLDNEASSPTKFEVSDHFFYLESSNLFSIDAVDNLYWGIKTAGAMNNTKSKTETDKSVSVSVYSASISGLVEYNYPVSDAFSIGLGANVGLNVLGFTTKEISSISDIDFPDTYHNLWKPYIQIGAHIAADYYFNPLMSVSLVGGYNYSIGITKWIDGFKILSNDGGAQKNISAFYVSLGLGIKF